MDNYVYFQGKKLRYGYTTGSSATAATKAALILLLDNERKKIDEVQIEVPAGQTITVPIDSVERKENSVIATVIKDGGDDPDVTHGLEIVSKVSFRNDNKINVFGGKGVGTVTKVGLPVEIGKSAINPTPMKMITTVAKTLLPEGKGADIEISVPLGEETAKKTMNGKLGIIGGISILGTMGIVRPMSEESWKSSLAIELHQILAEYYGKDGKLETNEENPKERKVVFLFGNRGKTFIGKNYPEKEKMGVVISNFVGYMLDKACEFKVNKIHFIGELGKFVKVAGGIFHTHSRVSDAKMEILTANALLVGEKMENLKKILASNTTEEATQYVENPELYSLLAEKAKQKCEEHCRKNGWTLEVETMILSAEKKVLGHSRKFFEDF